LEFAIGEIKAVVCEIESDKVDHGISKSIKEFHVFVEGLPGKERFVYASELADFRVADSGDICNVNNEIVVKGIGTDEKGPARLSRGAIICEARGVSYFVRSRKVHPGMAVPHRFPVDLAEKTKKVDLTKNDSPRFC
jgi:predicted RNA-binding protein with RPS1 domain